MNAGGELLPPGFEVDEAELTPGLHRIEYRLRSVYVTLSIQPVE
jgi:hypothetical protein